ncbi:MAG: hypothetical protein KDK54_21025 [Leptospiraceae bacterium]|nr:hypothetical protein [Leptospiraceae bacterium]
MRVKNDTIVNILSDLDTVKENLLSLSEDIWRSIDHNNPEAICIKIKNHHENVIIPNHRRDGAWPVPMAISYRYAIRE